MRGLDTTTGGARGQVRRYLDPGRGGALPTVPLVAKKTRDPPAGPPRSMTTSECSPPTYLADESRSMSSGSWASVAPPVVDRHGRHDLELSRFDGCRTRAEGYGLGVAHGHGVTPI